MLMRLIGPGASAAMLQEGLDGWTVRARTMANRVAMRPHHHSKARLGGAAQAAAQLAELSFYTARGRQARPLLLNTT